MKHQGRILRGLIKEAGYTQEDFASKIGISRNYLLVLLEKSTLNEEYIKLACQALNVNNNVFESKQQGQEYTHSNKMENRDREIELLEKHITSLEKIIEAHERTISELRRDVAIEAQQKTIKVLEEQKASLEKRIESSNFDVDKHHQELKEKGNSPFGIGSSKEKISSSNK